MGKIRSRNKRCGMNLIIILLQLKREVLRVEMIETRGVPCVGGINGSRTKVEGL